MLNNMVNMSVKCSLLGQIEIFTSYTVVEEYTKSTWSLKVSAFILCLDVKKINLLEWGWNYDDCLLSPCSEIFFPLSFLLFYSPHFFLIKVCFRKTKQTKSMCLSETHRICRVRSDDSGPPGPTLLSKQGHPGAHCTELHADNSWISPGMEIPQLDTATHHPQKMWSPFLRSGRIWSELLLK